MANSALQSSVTEAVVEAAPVPKQGVLKAEQAWPRARVEAATADAREPALASFFTQPF